MRHFTFSRNIAHKHGGLHFRRGLHLPKGFTPMLRAWFPFEGADATNRMNCQTQELSIRCEYSQAGYSIPADDWFPTLVSLDTFRQ